MGPFQVWEDVLPTIDLSSFGFFASILDSVTSTPAAGVTNTASFICPTDKIRRILSASADSNGAITSYFARFREVPVSGVPVYLPLQTQFNRLILEKDGLLWYPGTEIEMQTNHAAAQSTEFTIIFTEEDAGIAPTG